MDQPTKVKTYVGIALISMMVISGLIAGMSSDAPAPKAKSTQQSGW